MSSNSGEAEGGADQGAVALGESLLSRLMALRVKPREPGKRLLPNLLDADSLTNLAVLACLSALSGTGILFILNSEAKLVEDKSYSAILALLFVAVLVVQRYAERTVITRASAAIERTLHAWRVRISGKVGALSLRDMESFSRGRVQDGLVKNYEQLSQTIVPLVSGFESLILLSFMLVYVFFVSIAAGLLTAGVALLLVVGYLNTAKTMKPLMAGAAQADSALSRLSEDMVDGFKELRLDGEKTAALKVDVVEASKRVTVFRIKAAKAISELMSTGRSASYLLAAGIVFVLPIISSSNEGSIPRLVTAVLFLLGPLGGIVGAVQQFATAQFCLHSITEFERELDNALGSATEELGAPVAFSTINMVEVHYAHQGTEGEASFALRGLNFTLERGTIVFLTGANGSGKTTALRVLSGLYPVSSGRIELNGTALPVECGQAYRSLFSAVFADCHLFPKPYGLDGARLDALDEMLRYMGIRDKLPADLAGGFDPERLSTGQRKRLALCLAAAEGRPILILDEWAADQDPATRARFYTEILPLLKAKGKTILAITHDERYFGSADARYHMEEGRMLKVSGT